MFDFGGAAGASDEDIVCDCMFINRGRIKEEIQKGAHTMDELKMASDAGLACGCCQALLRKILAEELEKAGIQN